MANKIKVLFQDYNAIEASGAIPLQEDWNLKRIEKISYQSTSSGFEAAEEAFRIFNAPDDILSLEHKMILESYQGPSLSVGDVVEVYPNTEGDIANGVKEVPKAYLCASIGWQEALITPEKNTRYTPLCEPEVHYNGHTCSVNVNLYKDGKSICLQLTDKKTGEPITTATVNIPDINHCLPANHILIKNYSESKSTSPNKPSLIDSLEKAQIGKTVSSYNVSNFGAEVLEMEVTNPWILDQASTRHKEILKLQNNSSPTSPKPPNPPKSLKQKKSTKDINTPDI